MLYIRILFALFTLALSLGLQALPVKSFSLKNLDLNNSLTNNLNKKTPTPASSLGFEIGQHHPRYDQLKDYFDALDQASDRIKVTNIGKTPQQREQFLVTISSADNLKNLNTILAKRDQLTTLANNRKNNKVGNKADNRADNYTTNEPLVIWLGYSVHGDEISGANAAMVVAYYLAANQDKNITELLENTIIVLEPSINPDGMDRFVNWVNTYRNTTDNPDANHIEHNQNWVTGRTNHFWFDLNRDWLLLSQSESKNRIAYYHKYQPHVVGDFHEMNHNSTYFFQPGVKNRTHPLTPKGNVELTSLLATFHAKALDKKQGLYYSEEDFDDFYYGKGSTYPDINGSIGILFEQASSRGMQQETINGLLTFEDSIKNQVLTSFSTIKGAWENREKLKKYRHDFYQSSDKLAHKSDFYGYLLQEKEDKHRLQKLLNTLALHRIKAYPLTKNLTVNDTLFSSQDSYYIPLEQPQFRLIKALFNQQTHFKNNTFYDVSGWTLPLAMNIETHQLGSTWGLKLATQPWSDLPKETGNQSNKSAYAYAFEWQHFLSPKLLSALLIHDIKIRVATKAFSQKFNGKLHQFSTGTIVIPAGIQTTQNWQSLLLNTSNKIGIPLYAMTTGLTPAGIDLGSNSVKQIKKPTILLLGGAGISQYEAGEVRFYLDDTLNIPISIIDHTRLNKRNIVDYSHIILVDGNYTKISEKSLLLLKDWITQGGVVIAQKRAVKWLSHHEILAAKLVSQTRIDNLFDTTNLTYQEKESLASRKRISGTIFQTDLDTSHPLAYGYRKNTLPLFRNSTLIIEKPTQPFTTLATYTPEPLLSGYADKNLVNTLAHNAAIVAHNYGKGRVIASTDVLAFRGYWHGSSKLLANSIFFSKIFSTPIE
jgi:hypothetical protein